ncbi:MAG: hypothetical protein ACPGTU_08080 [Myxococcota bacterium]
MFSMLWMTLFALACSSDPGGFGSKSTDTSVASEDSGRVEDTASESCTDSDSDTGEELTCDVCPESSVAVMREIELDSLVTDVDRTIHNPLKGFMTSYLWGEPYADFPDQMEFLYLPMSQLWNETGETLESGLEPYMMAAADRGHHAVLRVFIDYPNRDYGLPEYLRDSVSCSPYSDYGGGCSPDYDDPELLEAMLGLIDALGERYDGDPRMGFVQLGMLGFWGEWHTYPHTEWFPSSDTQRAVLEAYDSAFSVTELQVRRAAEHSVGLRMGFHDDSFAYSTIGGESWFFQPGLEAAGAADRWQEVAIGGELRPELQSSVFNDDYVLGPFAQDVSECIDVTHATYLLNYYAFNGDGHGYLGEARIRAEQAALQMGYQFEIERAVLNVSGLQDRMVNAQLEIDIKQTGVAPFYYPVSVQARLDGFGDSVVDEEDLQGLLPGEHQTVSVDFEMIEVEHLLRPIHIDLYSPILQESQSIGLATNTPWSDLSGPTVLQWDFGCDLDGSTVGVGDVVGQTEEGCDCLCDVDGSFRSCGGAVCTPDLSSQD